MDCITMNVKIDLEVDGLEPVTVYGYEGLKVLMNLQNPNNNLYNFLYKNFDFVYLTIETDCRRFSHEIQKMDLFCYLDYLDMIHNDVSTQQELNDFIDELYSYNYSDNETFEFQSLVSAWLYIDVYKKR